MRRFIASYLVQRILELDSVTVPENNWSILIVPSKAATLFPESLTAGALETHATLSYPSHNTNKHGSAAPHVSIFTAMPISSLFAPRQKHDPVLEMLQVRFQTSAQRQRQMNSKPDQFLSISPGQKQPCRWALETAATCSALSCTCSKATTHALHWCGATAGRL